MSQKFDTMNPASFLAAVSLLLGMSAAPALAGDPGHYSLTTAHLSVAFSDFKDGFGVADPSDQNSPCTALLLGNRVFTPSTNWEGDLGVGINLNGPAVGVSNLVPPLAPAGGWLPNSAGLALPVPCPTQLGGSGNAIYLIWSGVNWRSAQGDSATELFLCTQLVFVQSSPGCLPLASANLRLWASACASAAAFSHDYTDGKGKHFDTYDLLGMKQDALSCAAGHSHDYSNSVQHFGSGLAAQGFDVIKNEAVVHTGSAGVGGAVYVAVCWQLDYFNFQNPLAPVQGLATTHDWKLILDTANPAGWVAALVAHLGPRQGTALLGGVYSHSPTAAGQNGFGPCAAGPLPEPKKPTPLA